MSKGGKTKRVAGVDLSFECFAYVGDPQDTSTWHLCLRVLGDELKTRNAIENALGRFDDVNVPDHLRQRLYDMVHGAALSHGIAATPRTFAANISARTPEAGSVPTAQPTTTLEREPVRRVLSTKQLRELEAMADARADEMLAALGLD